MQKLFSTKNRSSGLVHLFAIAKKKQLQLTLAAMGIGSQLTLRGVDLQLKLAGL